MAPNPLDPDALSRRLTDAVSGIWTAVVSPPRDPTLDTAIADRATANAPVVWLIGKVQAGKSSIVQALTGADTAEVGDGFKACTRTATVFDFPAEAPVLRFLDTRGLGEASYDADADIAFAESRAHLLLVVMKVMDPAQDVVLDAVRQARARHPDWPAIVAQTSLHEGYPPATGHPVPYPFDAAGTPMSPLPGDLARALAWQRQLFSGLSGSGPVRFVPLDFTRAGDGFEPRLYGIPALRDAIADIAPAAVTSALGAPGKAAGDALAARAHPHILGYATAAAAADVLPVAGAIAVPGVQAKLLHSLGQIYGISWDRRMAAEFAGALGAGVMARLMGSFAARQLGKLLPVYGQTAGAAAAAAMSFATTYALGKAACYYLERKRLGVSDETGVAQTYSDALRQAFTMARERTPDRTAPPDATGPARQ